LLKLARNGGLTKRPAEREHWAFSPGEIVGVEVVSPAKVFRFLANRLRGRWAAHIIYKTTIKVEFYVN